MRELFLCVQHFAAWARSYIVIAFLAMFLLL